MSSIGRYTGRATGGNPGFSLRTQEALERLKRAIATSPLTIRAAYRSFEEQQRLKESRLNGH